MMEHLDMYRDMYGPYVAAVEFYVEAHGATHVIRAQQIRLHYSRATVNN